MHIARQRSSPIVSINAPCAWLLSYPKIISQRNGGAAQIRLGWLQQPRFVALPDLVAHPCPAPSACGPHCTQHNKKEFVVGAPRRLPSRHSRRTVPIRRSNIALRRAPHPRLRASDRALLAWMAWWPSVLGLFLVVRPDTILRWHRAGFRCYWRWKSRGRPGRPRVSPELRELIRRMSKENPLWAPCASMVNSYPDLRRTALQ